MKKIINYTSCYKCNQNCLFCTRPDRKKEKTFEEIKKDFESFISKGYDYLILTGGEPTIRNDILEIIKMAKNLGFEMIQLQTNGIKFSDKKFAEKMIEGNENFLDIFLSIHAHTEALHVSLGNDEKSFRKRTEGIENILDLNVTLRTNTVICKQNYTHLPEIVDFLIGMGVRCIQLSSVHPNGRAMDNFDLVVPKIEDTIPFIKKAIDKRKDSKDVQILVEAVPFCLLGEYASFATENLIPLDYMTEDKTKTKKEECSNCNFFKRCPGIWRQYLKKFNINFNAIE
jgi:MoaA/NifB/PqqE/SkfB family radical SAM enzyme